MIILAYPHIYCLKHVTDQVNTFNLQERDGKLVRIVISCNLDHINWDVRQIVQLWVKNVKIFWTDLFCHTLNTTAVKIHKAINMKFYMMLCLQFVQTRTKNALLIHLELSRQTIIKNVKILRNMIWGHWCPPSVICWKKVEFSHFILKALSRNSVPNSYQSEWNLFLEQENPSLLLDILCLWRHFDVTFL